MSAREAEERGYGTPLTDEERTERHYEQYGTTELPPRGTGLSGLNSIGLIRSIGNPEYSINNRDVAGLIGGGLAGWYIAKRYPNMVVKYVGIVVGAELGILIARMTSNNNNSST